MTSDPDLAAGAAGMSGSPAAALVTRPPAPGHGCSSPRVSAREPASPTAGGPQSPAGVFRAAMSRDGPPPLLQREISQLSFSSISGLSGEWSGKVHRAEERWKTESGTDACAGWHS